MAWKLVLGHCLVLGVCCTAEAVGPQSRMLERIGRSSNVKTRHSASGRLLHEASNYVIADSYNHRCMEWSSGATHGRVVAGGHGRGSGFHQLDYPIGLAVDATGNLIIADDYNHRIMKWTLGATQGSVVAGGNDWGSGLHQLGHPQGITLDSEGDYIIADTWNHRVVKWKRGGKKGELLAGGHRMGSGLHQLHYPRGLVIDAQGNCVIADDYNSRVMRWTPGSKVGDVVAGGNGRGSGLDQLHYPTSLVIDEVGNLVIADTANSRIVKWAPGASFGQVTAGGKGDGNGLHQLRFPRSIAIEADGSYVIDDTSNTRIVRWAPGDLQGHLVAGGHGNGNGSFQFWYPWSIVLVPRGPTPATTQSSPSGTTSPLTTTRTPALDSTSQVPTPAVVQTTVASASLSSSNLPTVTTATPSPISTSALPLTLHLTLRVVGSIILTVNVEWFLSDLNAATVLRKSLARVAGQAISAVRVTLTALRRLDVREFVKPRPRQLNAGNVRADYEIVVRQNSVAPPDSVEKAIRSKTTVELAEIMKDEAEQMGVQHHIISVDSVSVFSTVLTNTTLLKLSTTEMTFPQYSTTETTFPKQGGQRLPGTGGQRLPAFVAMPWPGREEVDAVSIHVLFMHVLLTDPVTFQPVENSYPATGMERFGFEISTALPGEQLVEEVTVSPSALLGDPRERRVIEASCLKDEELDSRWELPATSEHLTKRLSMSSFRFSGADHIFFFFKVRLCTSAGVARTACPEDCSNTLGPTNASTTLHAFRLALTPWSGGTVLGQTEQVILLNRSSTRTWPGGIIEVAMEVGGAGEVDITAIRSSAIKSFADSLPDLIAEEDVQVTNIWVEGFNSGRKLHAGQEQVSTNMKTAQRVSAKKPPWRELASAPLIILRVLVGVPRPARRHEVETRLQNLQYSEQHARTFASSFEQYIAALGFEPEDMLVQISGFEPEDMLVQISGLGGKPTQAQTTTLELAIPLTTLELAIPLTTLELAIPLKSERVLDSVLDAWWWLFAISGVGLLLVLPSCLLCIWQWRRRRNLKITVADAVDDDMRTNAMRVSTRKPVGSRPHEFLSVFGPTVDHENKAFDDL